MTTSAGSNQGPISVEYLVLLPDQQRAEHGSRSVRRWDIPRAFAQGEAMLDAISATLKRLGLDAGAVYSAEHTYTVYRSGGIDHFSVFAADVGGEVDELAAGYTASEWLNAKEAERRILGRGANEGLYWVRRYVTEPKLARPELRLL
ncbi:MAG: hypothetical protein AAF219_07350 [Myxococcota bacterium]